MIGEPIVLAQKVIKTTPYTPYTSAGSEVDGFYVRHTYHIKTSFTYVDHEVQNHHLPFPWDIKAIETISQTSIPRITRSYSFRVDLWEDSEGKLNSFSFALKVM